MASVLLILTYLAAILLIGLLTPILSQRFRVPNILLLLLIGIGLGRIDYNGAPLISFPEIFMTGISILALVMIVFDSWSRLKLKKDYFSLHALWFSVVFLIFNLIFLTAFTMVVFDISSIFLALIFSALMSGTDQAVAMSTFKGTKNKVFEFLELESLLNTPFIVLIPFIILDLKEALKDDIGIAVFIGNIVPFLQQPVVGIAAGVLMGFVMLKFMRKNYSAVLSPLAVIASALLAYVIAENLNGSGIFAVASMGLLFGAVHLSHKPQLQSFASVFSNSLGIFVFVLIGIIVSIDFSANFLIKSLLLFLGYILIRFISMLFALRGMDFTIKEKIFMSLNVQKGIAVAVVVFFLATLDIDGTGTVLNLAIAFMLYSIVLSSVVLRIAKFFIKNTKEKKV